MAAELVALPVDVIVVEGGGFGAANTEFLSHRIPVVSPVLMDPVERGLAASLARPGGNITGFTLMHTELNGKRLDLLRSAFPQITAVTALVNPSTPSSKLAFEQTETAARSLGLGDVRRVEAESAAALRALRPEVFWERPRRSLCPTGQARGLKAHGAVTAAMGPRLLRAIGISSPRQ